MGRKQKRRPSRTAQRRGPPASGLEKPPLPPNLSAAPATQAVPAADRLERAEPAEPSNGRSAGMEPLRELRDGGGVSIDDSVPPPDLSASEPPTDWARLEQRWLVLFHLLVWGAAAVLWLGRGGSGALELDSAGQVVAPSAVLPVAEAGPSSPGKEASDRASIAAERPLAPRAPRLLVDVNAAPAEELALLPGVGETLAARIIAFRTAKGPFTRMDQLLDVPGLGPKTLERLKPLLVPLPVAGAK